MKINRRSFDSVCRKCAANSAQDDNENYVANFRLRPLAVLAVEKVAHGLAARRVGLGLNFALVGVHAVFSCRLRCFLRHAALRTAVGEARLVRLQLKFFTADDAGFDRECHTP